MPSERVDTAKDFLKELEEWNERELAITERQLIKAPSRMKNLFKGAINIHLQLRAKLTSLLENTEDVGSPIETTLPAIVSPYGTFKPQNVAFLFPRETLESHIQQMFIKKTGFMVSVRFEQWRNEVFAYFDEEETDAITLQCLFESYPEWIFDQPKVRAERCVGELLGCSPTLIPSQTSQLNFHISVIANYADYLMQLKESE